MSSKIQAIRDTIHHAYQNPQESANNLANRTYKVFSQNKLTLGTLAATALTCYYSPKTITTRLPELLQQYPRVTLAAAGTLASGTTKAIQSRIAQPIEVEDGGERIDPPNIEVEDGGERIDPPNIEMQEGDGHVVQEDFELNQGNEDPTVEAPQADIPSNFEAQPGMIELGTEQELSMEMPPTGPIKVSSKASKPIIDRISDTVSFKKEDSIWTKGLKTLPLLVFVFFSTIINVLTGICSFIKGIFTPKTHINQ